MAGDDLLTRVLPGAGLLCNYRRDWLRVDLLAGLTVGAMFIPQGMAYAELAGMPPVTGFYAALLALVAYALVGSSRHLGVGPEPGTAILAATGVAAVAGGDPARYAALMGLLALLVGGLCVAAATARLGFLADLLSKPVLVGYITGVGFTLLSSQFARFTGVPITSDSFFPRVRDLLTGLGSTGWGTLALGAATLGLILGLKRTAPRLPGALLGVGLATVAAAIFDLAGRGIAVVGDIPSGLPSFGLPEVGWGDVGSLLPVAAGIALVGYTDNILTARSIAAGLGYKVDAGRELLALGVVNLCSGFSQGFPISSSASRTAVPASLGSRTQLVGVVAAGFLLATLLFLGPVLSEIPQPALAAVIVAAALAIIDVGGYRALWKVSRTEFGLAVASALGVMVFDVLVGVLIAVALSIVVALGRMAFPHDAVLATAEGLDGWVDADTYAPGETLPGLLVYRFDAPLFFINADRFRERLQLMLEENPGEEEWVILDFEGIGEVDATALDVLSDLANALTGSGITLGVARTNERALDRLRRAGLTRPEGPLAVYPTINGAVGAFRARPPG